MLFLLIYEYSPENRNAIFDKYIQKGPMMPAGVKEVGMWNSLSGGQVFSIYETNDPAALARFGHEWNDLGAGEVIPIMDCVEYLKVVKGDDIKKETDKT